MIKCNLFILLLLIGGSNLLFSQTLMDSNGDVMVTIDSIGVMKDVSNNEVGKISSNGEIFDMTNDLLGMIDGIEFKDASGYVIGSIDANHIVYDVNNMVLGSIDGLLIKDVNNMTIGETSLAMDEKKLAAFFFFFFTH